MHSSRPPEIYSVVATALYRTTRARQSSISYNHLLTTDAFRIARADPSTVGYHSTTTLPPGRRWLADGSSSFCSHRLARARARGSRAPRGFLSCSRQFLGETCTCTPSTGWFAVSGGGCPTGAKLLTVTIHPGNCSSRPPWIFCRPVACWVALHTSHTSHNSYYIEIRVLKQGIHFQFTKQRCKPLLLSCACFSHRFSVLVVLYNAILSR